MLARKWRPQLFREMVGQEHVLRALINALDHDRLHHAYLFTGTRGVGKTTIARILAKCLNCETGVSSEPCNQCSACNEINEGRFIDLIEVDAASRTKVEDTRELLENVQYAPTRGRYKVYLIDEVHMLSNSSFNALLKTLEEPPPHVKFLLATTDPQKLPVTVLSRCLQFSLKNMSAERIVGHLQAVLSQEMIPFEEAGLWQLGRAADGSMRDALSLTDQAIAFSNGKVIDTDVRTMLGTIDQSLVYSVIQGLIAEDTPAILNAVDELAEHAPDYSSVLAELLAILHRIAIAQALPEAVDNSIGDRQQIYDFAQAIRAEDVQLYYQIALMGRRDLPLSPDPRSGFEMVMLRMLAFKPQGVPDIPTRPLSGQSQPTSNKQSTVPTAADSTSLPVPDSADAAPKEGPQPTKKHEVVDDGTDRAIVSSSTYEMPAKSVVAQIDTVTAVLGEPLLSTTVPTTVSNMPTTVSDMSTRVSEHSSESPLKVGVDEACTNKVAAGEVREAKVPVPQTPPQTPPQTKVPAPLKLTRVAAEESYTPVLLEQLNADNWLDVYRQIDTDGLLQSTVANCAYIGQTANQTSNQTNSTIEFILDEQQSTLYDVSHQQRLADLLSHYFQQTVKVSIQLGVPASETPAQIILRQKQERQRQAEQAIQSDPTVSQLKRAFGATIIENSIKPIDED